jgi:hypothetical protein
MRNKIPYGTYKPLIPTVVETFAGLSPILTYVYQYFTLRLAAKIYQAPHRDLLGKLQ